MKMRGIFLGILMLFLLSTVSIRVYAAELEFFTMDELDQYIEKSNKAWAEAGYSTSNGITTYSATQNKLPSVEQKACEHSYVDEVISEATCSQEGEVLHTCKKCNDSYSTVMEATGQHVFEGIVTKAASCSEKGEITYTCQTCEEAYTETVPQLVHEYDSQMTKEVTCTEAGENTVTCNLCGDTYTEEIAPIGHIAGEWMTTKTVGLFTDGMKVKNCINCGEECESEIIPSQYPIYYLYIGIGLGGACLALVILFFCKAQKRKA